MNKTSIPPYRVFSIYAIVFLFGVFLFSFFHISYSKSWPVLLTLCLVLILAGLINYLLKNRLLVIFSWSLAILSATGAYFSYFDSNYLMLDNSENVSIEGIIKSKPEIDFKKQRAVVETNTIDGQKVNPKIRILVDFPKYPVVSYGDEVTVSGAIQSPSAMTDYSYQKYLKKNLISGLIFQPTSVQKTGESGKLLIRMVRWFYMISSYFEQSLNMILPEPQASLASGLILGIKRNIPADLSDDLSKSGLTHIIALSGFNVTIIMKVISDLLRKPLGKKKTFILGVLLVIIFVVMTGAASSVVRAAIFSTLIIYGATIGRKADQTNLMLLAALIMVLINPFVLVNDVGFQLSFLAFSGLIYISPLIRKAVSISKINNWPEAIKSPLIETLGAQIAVFPLIVYVFGRLSLIAPVANLIVLWIVPLAMLVSFIAGLGGLIVYTLGKLLALFAWPVLSYIIYATKITASLPLASFDIGRGSVVLMIVLYMVIGLFLIFGYRKYKVVA